MMTPFTSKTARAAALTGMLLLSLAMAANAQPYVEGGQTRHRFAQLNMGLMFRHFPATGTSVEPLGNGATASSPLRAQGQAAFVMGGNHFWGHADFYVAIPLVGFGPKGFLPGVETAAKYYPWRVENRKLRPYLGAGWQPAGYRQGEGVEQSWHEWPLLAGLTFNRNQLLLELGAAYSFKPGRTYFTAPMEQARVRTHPLCLSLSAKWMLETTLSAEKDWLSGRTEILTDTLAKLGRLDGFTLAVGPSSATMLSRSSHNEDFLPFLYQHNRPAVFIEFGAGYYWHKPDLQLNLAYRGMSFLSEGFGYWQEAKRRALTLEAYKFFGDYHGFAPFAGPALSNEWLSLEGETDQGEQTLFRDWQLQPGLVFGWDIRPNRIQRFYLRTNLRWFPFLDLPTADGRSFSFHQLEFNFIQLVWKFNRS